MALSSYKITNGDISSRGVQSAPDRLTGTAAENKAVFDRLITEVVRTRLNGLIDEIAEELAGKMDAPGTYGAVGEYLRIGSDGLEWDTPSGAGDMLVSVYDSDNDGRVDRADAALSCSGNAATATKLKTARTLTVKDNAQSHSGPAVSFDGSANTVLRLPATIAAALVGNVTGNVTGNVSGSAGGNAATATKLKTARTLTVKDNAKVHGGTGVSFDGSASVVLPLPATIRANLEAGTIVLDSGSYGTTLPAAGTAGRLFFKKV